MKKCSEAFYILEVLGSMLYLKEIDARIVEVPEDTWCEIDDADDLARARSRFGE